MAPEGSAHQAVASAPARLTEAVRLLGEAYRPERIYLFGSWARGDARPDSDLDLLVVVPDDAGPERRQSRLAYETLWKTGASGDILVWTRKRFDACLHLPATLPATVVREGRLVYGS
jgi:UTP:GlnB (protein PII) uridylyltransferase